jgi:outer membrane protein OmpA-like peptidoglycan-associated protein
MPMAQDVLLRQRYLSVAGALAMSKTILVATLTTASLLTNIGCATKKYVRNQLTPINNKIGELDEISSKNSKEIQEVNGKAEQGITAAGAADQRAAAAGESAQQANQGVARVGNNLSGLQGTVENLDNYKPVANTTVLFGTSKFMLTKADQQALDEFAQQIGQQKHFIVSVQGYTDSTGSKEYNNQLSRRRADAVIQYLVAAGHVPAFRIYIIGLGQDNPVAENNNAAGRKKNRRVDVQLLTNSLESASAQSNPPAPPPRQDSTDKQ